MPSADRILMKLTNAAQITHDRYSRIGWHGRNRPQPFLLKRCGPLGIAAIFNLIAKPGPFKLTIGYGTTQLDFGLADSNDLPVALPLTAFNPYLLTHLERIGLEQGHIISRHSSLSFAMLLIMTIRLNQRILPSLRAGHDRACIVCENLNHVPKPAFCVPLPDGFCGRGNDLI